MVVLLTLKFVNYVYEISTLLIYISIFLVLFPYHAIYEASSWRLQPDHIIDSGVNFGIGNNVYVIGSSMHHFIYDENRDRCKSRVNIIRPRTCLAKKGKRPNDLQGKCNEYFSDLLTLDLSCMYDLEYQGFHLYVLFL